MAEHLPFQRSRASGPARARANVQSAVLLDIRDKEQSWDEWIERRGDGAGFCQTSVWARINRVANGVEPYFILVDFDGQWEAGALFGLRVAGRNAIRTPRTGKQLWERQARSLECFEGPELAGQDKRLLLTALLEFIDRLAGRLRVGQIRFAKPPARCDWRDLPEIRGIFSDFGYDRQPWATALVDLRMSEKKLLAGFRHAARKGIRKCQDAGITVCLHEDFDAYVMNCLKPYFAAVRPDDAIDAAVSRARQIWHIDQGRHYRYFAAHGASEDVLAVLGTYRFNGVATEIMSARTANAIEQKSPAQDLLHWEVLRAHKALGDRLFDLAGFNPEPKTPKEAGIKRFKEKWGGEVVEVPIYTKRLKLSPLDRLRTCVGGVRHRVA